MIFALLILIVVAVIGMGIVSLFWGLFTLLGFLLIITALYIMIVHQKGKINISLANPFVWLLVVGIILLAASKIFGIEILEINIPNVLELV